MFTKLQDNEIGQHIHDLVDVNNGILNVPFAEDCIHRFIRTFADVEMRHDYEKMWTAFPTEDN